MGCSRKTKILRIGLSAPEIRLRLQQQIRPEEAKQRTLLRSFFSGITFAVLRAHPLEALDSRLKITGIAIYYGAL